MSLWPAFCWKRERITSGRLPLKGKSHTTDHIWPHGVVCILHVLLVKANSRCWSGRMRGDRTLA
eukprot:6469582-Amphidinium_carterae.1